VEPLYQPSIELRFEADFPTTVERREPWLPLKKPLPLPGSPPEHTKEVRE
jgi:hypothetical protein